jgi:3-oxoadipate enol-lactonase
VSATLLHHYVDGPPDAPPIVLLHSIATHSAMWYPQLAVWSSAFRVVRIDLPGHGGSALNEQVQTMASYAAQVRDVMDALDIEKAGIVGLSLGGMIGQAFAFDHPDRLSALVLAHSGARTEPAVREVWNRRLEHLAQHGLMAQVGPTLQRWFTRAFAAESPMTMEWLARQIRTTSPEGYVAAVKAIQQLDHADRLSEIGVATLVIAGEEDSAIPPAAAKAIADRIERSKLVLLKQTAHFGNVEQPVLFGECVGEFLLEHLIDGP